MPQCVDPSFPLSFASNPLFRIRPHPVDSTVQIQPIDSHRDDHPSIFLPPPVFGAAVAAQYVILPLCYCENSQLGFTDHFVGPHRHQSSFKLGLKVQATQATMSSTFTILPYLLHLQVNHTSLQRETTSPRKRSRQATTLLRSSQREQQSQLLGPVNLSQPGIARTEFQ